MFSYVYRELASKFIRCSEFKFPIIGMYLEVNFQIMGCYLEVYSKNFLFFAGLSDPLILIHFSVSMAMNAGLYISNLNKNKK